MLQLCLFRLNLLCSDKIYAQKKNVGLGLGSIVVWLKIPVFALPPSRMEMVQLHVVARKTTGNVSSSS